MSNLPLELLDIILQKSYLMCTRKKSLQSEDTVNGLASVSDCWFRRIIRRRFKKAIRRNLAGDCIHVYFCFIIMISVRSSLSINEYFLDIQQAYIVLRLINQWGVKCIWTLDKVDHIILKNLYRNSSITSYHNSWTPPLKHATLSN